MKRLTLIILLSSLPLISYGNEFTQITSRGIVLEYISYQVGSDLYDLRVGVSSDAESLSTISMQYGAISGINGVFFCPADYTACGGQNYTINERFIGGLDASFYTDTGERGVFGWDENTVPFLHQTGKINPELRSNIFEGLGNFPILYADGKNMLEYYHDIGLYDNKMSAKLKRHFICSNKDKTEIFFGSSSATSLDSLAPALYDIGCWDGLNLDAGASTFFNYNGRELETGSRKVLDTFLIVPRSFSPIEINTKIDLAMIEISRIFKGYDSSNALNNLTVIREYLSKKRSEIYEANSNDNYDINGDLNGYVLNITNQTTLQKVYLYNILDIKLGELYKEILLNN